MIKQQAVNKWTETCELCAWIHYMFSRPDASRKLKGKLEFQEKKKKVSAVQTTDCQGTGTVHQGVHI